QRQWIGLCLHTAVAVPGILGKDKLVWISFLSQHPGHPLVSQNPIVIVVARAQVVPVTDMHPDPQRLPRALRNQSFMQVPRAVWAERSPGAWRWPWPPPLRWEAPFIAGRRFSAIRLSRAVNNVRSGPSASTINGASVPATYCLGTYTATRRV